MINPNMVEPKIRYYARLEDCTEKKTPKYVIKTQAGEYPPMEKIKDRNGDVSMYLLASRDSGSNKDNAPAMKLQAARSLNVTGLKNYFVDGKLSGYAYGYPLEAETYSKEKKPNPFFEYKDDGYIFIIHQNDEASTEAEKLKPSCIELIVLEGAKKMIPDYCKQLMMGGFDDALRALREQAIPPFLEEANDGFVEFRDQD